MINKEDISLFSMGDMYVFIRLLGETFGYHGFFYRLK